MKLTKYKFALLLLSGALLLLMSSIVAGRSNAYTPAAVRAQTRDITLMAQQDAFVSETSPGANYGSLSEIYVGRNSSGYDSHILVQFDLSSLPTDAVVISATLQMYQVFNQVQAESGIQQTYDVWADAVTESWDETAITWNNKPAAANQGDPALAVPSSGIHHDWDVTNIVREWASGALTNYGILLRGDGVTIGGRSYYALPGGSAPKLVIAYTSDTYDWTFTAQKDTYVHEANPDANYGSLPEVYIGRNSSGYDSHILVQFDLSDLPAGAVVLSATLQMSQVFNQVQAESGIHQTYDVWADAVTSYWNETTVTWNNKPGAISQGDPPLAVPVGYTYHNWNVTNIVQGWVAGSLPNYGILLRGDGVTVGGRSYYALPGGSAPKLIVTYSAATPIPTHTSTATPSSTSTVTPTPTNTPPVSGSCPGTVYIFPDKDTWTGSSNPVAVHGNDDQIVVSTDMGNHRYALLHFPVEGVVPPDQYIYSAQLVLDVDGDIYSGPPPPWSVMYYTLNGPFDETTTNWNNQPYMYTLYGAAEVGDEDSHIINIRPMVESWHKGSQENHGLGLSPISGDYIFRYYSREVAEMWERPRIMIACGYYTPTPTSTPTRTPTRTSTPTPTATPGPATADFVAFALEVTQGVQDLSNSVRLVEGKRTFVRLHVEVNDAEINSNTDYWTTAKLYVHRGTNYPTTLLPINNSSGYVNLPGPEGPMFREVVDHAFLFELPDEFTSGEIELKGYVNPGFDFPETHTYNNAVEETVSFEPVPPMNLVMFKFGYQDENTGEYIYPATTHLNMLWRYLKRLYPVSDIPYRSRTYQYDDDLPNCDQVNWRLALEWVWDEDHDDDFPDGMRYYGLVSDEGGFMRGCAMGIPSKIASGPAGVSGGWDTDGSYADWYGAHELGHTLGRHHPGACGDKTGCYYIGQFEVCPDGFRKYPYPDGRISPTKYDYLSTTIFGFDPVGWQAFAVRHSEWKDIMTYCDNLWISDFTYHAIMNKLQSYGSQNAVNRSDLNQTDRLLVSGSIYSETGEIDLGKFFVIPDAGEVIERVPGDYAIVMKDSTGSELARYAFTPSEVHEDQGPSSCQLAAADDDFIDALSFTELVPYMIGTTRVDIEGPTGVLTSVIAGANSPTVTLTSPNGNQILYGDTITVTWTASDPDGEPLVFNVQYSADNGANWNMVAQEITEQSVVLDAANVSASEQGRFRVWASDGIHTASDVSDAAFTIPNRPPQVEILQPSENMIMIVSQTIGLEGHAYDVDTGTMDETQLEWHSDIDGLLGNGDQLSISTMSVGTHTIMFLANDGAGGMAADTVQVAVYADPFALPPLSDLLKVAPAVITLEPAWGVSGKEITIYNLNNPDPIAWNAVASDSWVQLSATSGNTPNTITVTANETELADGFHYAVITVTNSSVPTESVTVNVGVNISPYFVYLPIILKSD